MALFIHAENQKLLWETINKSPLILQNPSFNANPDQKSEWFREIVKQVYYSIPASATRVLSRDELQQYNRTAITAMLGSLQGSNRSAVPPSPSATYPNNPVGQQPGVRAAPVSILKEPMTEFSRNTVKKNEFQEQFSNRQKEYETMFQKTLPKEINFSEQMDDGIITNMEELIQQQKRQREMEISQQFTVGVSPPELPIPPNQGQTVPLSGPPATIFISETPPPPPASKRLQITDEIPIPENEVYTMDLGGGGVGAAQPQEINLLDNWRESIMSEMEKMREQIAVLQRQLQVYQIKKDVECVVDEVVDAVVDGVMDMIII